MAKAEVSSVNYQALEQERLHQSRAALKQKLKSVSEADLGKYGSLRRLILSHVVSENYESGKEALREHVEIKGAQYPILKDRADKFVNHACDLIQAIQTKRSFPGLGTLSLSKQQELTEKVLIHFHELKQTLKSIERSERDVKLADMRSTAWTVSTFSHLVLFLASALFIYDLQNGLWHSFTFVFRALVDDVVFQVETIFHWR